MLGDLGVGQVVRLGEVVDRDGDIDAFDRVVGDADRALEVRRRLTGRRITADGRQRLGDVACATAGVEDERAVARLRPL